MFSALSRYKILSNGSLAIRFDWMQLFDSTIVLPILIILCLLQLIASANENNDGEIIAKVRIDQISKIAAKYSAWNSH